MTKVRDPTGRVVLKSVYQPHVRARRPRVSREGQCFELCFMMGFLALGAMFAVMLGYLAIRSEMRR